MRRDDEANVLILEGVGATAPAALRALLDQLPLADGDTLPQEDVATVIRASATTLEQLVPRFVSAMQAAEEDLDLMVTAIALDGLLATDDGWRAWGTVTGPASTGGRSAARWTPQDATVERAGDVVTLRLTLRGEGGDD